MAESTSVNISPSSYDDVVTKLDRLFSSELTQVQSITDVRRIFHLQMCISTCMAYWTTSDVMYSMCTHTHDTHVQDHWKVQDFPLARIKKIMRMDEDVRVSIPNPSFNLHSHTHTHTHTHTYVLTATLTNTCTCACMLYTLSPIDD